MVSALRTSRQSRSCKPSLDPYCVTAFTVSRAGLITMLLPPCPGTFRCGRMRCVIKAIAIKMPPAQLPPP